MRINKCVTPWIILFGVFFTFALPNHAQAVPSFARQNGIGCSSCHSHWPQLTSFGRKFKENGYKLSNPAAKISDYLKLDQEFPISARLNMRVIDKRTSKAGSMTKSKDKVIKMRALHEAEVFLAGAVSEKLSVFAELEAEDEWPDPSGDAPGFQVQFVTGVLEYAYNDSTRFLLGRGSPLWADAYNTLNHAKPFRKEWAVSANGFTPGTSQFISIAGRPVESLSYVVSWSGNDESIGGTANGNQLEGKDPSDLLGRIAFDITPQMMIGGYYQGGKAFDAGTGKADENYNRTGIDFQGEFGSLALNAVYATMDAPASTDSDSAFSAELSRFKRDGDRLKGVCSVIFSKYSSENNTKRVTEAALFFTHFFMDNIKSQLGWERDLKTYNEEPESRATLVVDLAF